MLRRQSIRSIVLASALLAAVLIVSAGCRQGSSPPDDSASVRVLNSVESSSDIQISMNGKSLDTVSFGGDSGFNGVAPGHYSLGVTVDSQLGASSDYPFDLNVDSGSRCTAIAYGSASAVAPLQVALFDEPANSTAVDPDKAQVRVFNASPGSGKLDLLINSIVAFKNVEYGTPSPSIPLAALPYEWTVKPAGDSDEPLIDPVTLRLKGGKNYLVVIMGRPENQTLTIKAFEE